MNIVLGIIGAAVASFLLSIFGINLGGWLGYLIRRQTTRERGCALLTRAQSGHS